MTSAEILAALERISDRIDVAFSEDGDKYDTDKHYCLEQVGDQVTALIEELQADQSIGEEAGS